MAEYINRRILTHEDGTEEIVTVARSEGAISQEGDAFNAETMNELEERIEVGFSALNNLSFVAMSQATYDTLTTKDANTIYFTT